MPITFITQAKEDSSCRLKFVIEDFDGNDLGFSDITTMTMTLKDKDGNVINSQDGTNVLSSGNFVLDEDSTSVTYNKTVFTYFLDPADNPILTGTDDNDMKSEIHIATFNIIASIGGSSRTLVETAWIEVEANKGS